MISNELITFAKGNADFYTAYEDYHNHKAATQWNEKLGAYDTNVALSEKSEKVYHAYFAEIEKMSNCPLTDANRDAWFANPVVRWAELAVENAMLNLILPAYVQAAFAPFVNMRLTGYADAIHVEVPAKTLFTNSLGAKGERVTHRQRKFRGDLVLSPVEHIITEYVDMARVYARKDDIAEAMHRVVISAEIGMNNEINKALNAGLAGASQPSQFKESGAFEPKKLVQLAQRVQAYNGMAKPIILGTAAALMNVLPDSTLGYRTVIDGKDGVVSYVRNFYGFDVYELPQAPTGTADFGMALSDTALYVVSPAVNKVIEGAVVTAMTNGNQFYDNADLTSNGTLRKAYDFQFSGGAFIGYYDVTE